MGIADEARAKLEGITPGPWEVEEQHDPLGDTTYCIPGIERFRGYTNNVYCGIDKALAEFIAAAPALVRGLLEELEGAQGDLGEVRTGLGRAQTWLEAIADLTGGDGSYVDGVRSVVAERDAALATIRQVRELEREWGERDSVEPVHGMWKALRRILGGES
ncbi:hypothetical protein SEA_HALO3_7 [Gordonia phage Halo3]|uniref:Uncharacterized protein n=1 Tax=Gordonia phage Halo3 TaxID=3077826 RepID=A0AA96KNQ4_9CAUD|nr:hypothetical protein SEA_HALO3_7 [Gordonia phage Halo3]